MCMSPLLEVFGFDTLSTPIRPNQNKGLTLRVERFVQTHKFSREFAGLDGANFKSEISLLLLWTDEALRVDQLKVPSTAR